MLSFCIFTKECYANTLTPAVRALNFATFGHDMAVLHENDIRRSKGAFSTFGKNTCCRQRPLYGAVGRPLVAARNGVEARPTSQ
ncbi:MAG: hypothetical protein EON54_24690 [Alcaligenaceae bacterium]|nr:MAG: hypothetical protein EON54_24690 [Alcaligenaceae bacterium]